MPTSNLHDALLLVQKNIPTLQKDGVNPHFKNTYITLNTLLDSILPLLNENGIVLLQSPSVVDGQPALKTELLHVTTGQTIISEMLLVLGKQDPQGQGSAITYARRYSLMAIL